MPEPEGLSKKELDGLAKLVASGKITDEADLAQAQQILSSHGVEAQESSAIGDLLGGAMTAVEQGVGTATFGLGPKLAGAIDPEYTQRAEQRAEQYPTAAAVGSLGGYMMPGTGPARVAGATGAAVRSLPMMAARMGPTALKAGRPTASVASRALTSGAVGAASGAAATAAEQGAELATGSAESPEKMIEEMVASSLMGAAMGPVAETVSGLGGRMYHGLREKPKYMPWIRKLEEGGGGIGTLGLRPPTGYREATARAVAGGRTSGSDQAAEDAAKMIHSALGDRSSAIASRQSAANARYYNSPEGKAGADSLELLDEVMQTYGKQAGTAFSQDSATAQMLKDIHRLSEVKVVPRGAPRPEGSGAYKLSGGREEAKRLLGDNAVEGALARTGAPAETVGAAADSGMDFYLVPKRVSAEALDVISKNIQRMVKKDFPDAERFQRAAFKVRDRFPGNSVAPDPGTPKVLPDGTEIKSGWSNLKRQHHEELGELETMKAAGGLGRGESIEAISGQVEKITQALFGHGERGRGRSLDAMKKLLEDNPAGAEAYRRFLASKGYERVLHSSGLSVSGGVNPGTGNPYSFVRAGDFLKMRMDPAASAAMRASPELAGQTAAAIPAENLQQLMAIFAEQEE